MTPKFRKWQNLQKETGNICDRLVAFVEALIKSKGHNWSNKPRKYCTKIKPGLQGFLVRPLRGGASLHLFQRGQLHQRLLGQPDFLFAKVPTGRNSGVPRSHNLQLQPGPLRPLVRGHYRMSAGIRTTLILQ